MTEVLAVALILFAGLIIRSGVKFVLQRLSIFPEDSAARSGGAGDVVGWLRRRREASPPGDDSDDRGSLS